MADKEQAELLDERIISNRGLIVHTPDEEFRRFWIQLDVIRFPKQNFLNKIWNPDRSDYAKITFLRDGQVLREETMRYEKQTFIWDVDITGYLTKFLVCAYTSLTAQLTEIGAAVGVTFTPGEPIPVVPIQDQFDQILIVVRPDGAIAAQLYGLKYDVACEDAEAEPQPPPPPPDFPNYPPGTPLADTDTPASQPYDPPNDGGNTVPLPEDVVPPPPPIPDCTILLVNYIADAGGGTTFNRTKRVYAPYSGARISPSANNVIQMFCANAPTSPCTQPPAWYNVNTFVVPIVGLTVVSVTPE